jgi:hypothetical protein
MVAHVRGSPAPDLEDDEIRLSLMSSKVRVHLTKDLRRLRGIDGL